MSDAAATLQGWPQRHACVRGYLPDLARQGVRRRPMRWRRRPSF
ncbi:hypothetical protein ACF1BQ_043595 [Bradyrhizobium sp. RDT10]